MLKYHFFPAVLFLCVVFFREQTPLEEGEIPWVMYNEDSGSSSDEDPDGVSQFVHPGLFILDGNNNLEDDSSMSEDLDTEWRSVKHIDKLIIIIQNNNVMSCYPYRDCYRVNLMKHVKNMSL